MTLPLTAPIIIVFAIIGLLWGWLRVVILLAFVGLGLLLFSFLAGGAGLANFICVKAPAIFGAAVGQAAPQFCTPSPQFDQIMTLVGFGGLGLIGSVVGGKVASGTPSAASRFMGAFFGILTGLAVAFFLYNFLPPISVTSANPVSYLSWILVIIGVLGAVALVMKGMKKSGGAKK